MDKKKKIGKVCKLCSHSLGCWECSEPDYVPSNEQHSCVYKYPLDDDEYISVFDRDYADLYEYNSEIREQLDDIEDNLPF